MKNVKILFLSNLFLIAVLISSSVFAKEPVSTSYVDNSAIGQHDATAYHLSKTASIGEKRFSHEWKGAQWYFATLEQRDLFAANPSKFSPAYNGFCSNALTLNEGLINTNGMVWHIFGDQLHLFFAERGRVRWVNGDYDKLKKEADAAWEIELARFN